MLGDAEGWVYLKVESYIRSGRHFCFRVRKWCSQEMLNMGGIAAFEELHFPRCIIGTPLEKGSKLPKLDY